MTRFTGEDRRKSGEDYNKVIWFLISIFVAISGTVTWASFQNIQNEMKSLAGCVKDGAIRDAVLESHYNDIKDQLLYIRKSIEKHQ